MITIQKEMPLAIHSSAGAETQQHTITLHPSLYERMQQPYIQRLLGSEFMDAETFALDEPFCSARLDQNKVIEKWVLVFVDKWTAQGVMRLLKHFSTGTLLPYIPKVEMFRAPYRDYAVAGGERVYLIAYNTIELWHSCGAVFAVNDTNLRHSPEALHKLLDKEPQLRHTSSPDEYRCIWVPNKEVDQAVCETFTAAQIYCKAVQDLRDSGFSQSIIQKRLDL